MLERVYAPRLNNNDDFVTVTRVAVALNDHIDQGALLAEVETAKTAVEVLSERDGFVVAILCQTGSEVAVGTPLFVIGDAIGAAVPDAPVAADAIAGEADAAGAAISGKARLLMARHGLTAADLHLPPGTPVTVAEVTRAVERKGSGIAAPRPAAPSSSPAFSAVAAPGGFAPMTAGQRMMDQTVRWHRDAAAAGYIELEYDPAPWQAHARSFQQERRLMTDPAIPMLAHKLARFVGANAEKFNATVEGGRRYLYDAVHLGMTVQYGDQLIALVIHDAASLSLEKFLAELGRLTKAVVTRSLAGEDMVGATVGFSSMARWPVSRHVPLLLPHTALMIAHTAPRAAGATIGASYDHRVLNGFDVVRALTEIVRP
jgi:pyruvate dehydrogenase E2 component (dihydrolipoamide acetyltransferase)